MDPKLVFTPEGEERLRQIIQEQSLGVAHDVKPVERWVIIDFFGHTRLAGRVTEVQQFGATMGRLKVPAVDGRAGFVKDFSGGSVFGMSDVTEEVAVAYTRAQRPAPVQPYELRMLPPAETPPDAEEVGCDHSGECVDCGNVTCTCDDDPVIEDDDGDPS